MDRVAIVHDNFLRRVAADDLPAGPEPCAGLTKSEAKALFKVQCQTRALDLVSREMQKAGQGFYTIGSSGHEGMAALAHALRPDDIAFLHYRDGAFQVARAAQAGQANMVRDMLYSFACATADPISGGRHKVLGSASLMIPPQTSTIASHLPKAVGAAFSIGAARRRKPEHQTLPDDSIAICSFGDASLNHSTAQGAINSAGWTSIQGTPLPLLFVCEDNGIGISTKTPDGWVEASVAHRPGLRYFKANGLDMYETYAVAREAAEYVRTHRKPAFLHLSLVRLYGHAGPDIATSYLPTAEVEQQEANDPLLHSVRLLRDAQASSPAEALEHYQTALEQTRAIAHDAPNWGRLNAAPDVMASLVPPKRVCARANGPTDADRAGAFGSDMKSMDQPQPMSRLLNWALTDLMLAHPEVTIMGEDVGRKGGVYGVTQKLQPRFGRDRVIDTLLDEQSILGLSIGMAHNGFIPIPEIQFLAYLHNAEDQLRGEAATLPFFSNGQFTNPMVIRIAGLGYQKGIGGHFHNDNSIAVLRDIPGLIIACPSRGDDGAKMLRECVRLAREEQRIVVFLEPIALYPMRDVAAGDGAWMQSYPDPQDIIHLGDIGIHGTGTDVAIVTYGNGAYLSAQAVLMAKAQGIEARVIDMRWLAPLPWEAILEATSDCDNILIVDECRRTGGQAEVLMSSFAQAGRQARALTAEDSFIATGPAYDATLPTADGILYALIDLCGQKKKPGAKAGL